jgi:hypothetical protein
MRAAQEGRIAGKAIFSFCTTSCRRSRPSAYADCHGRISEGDFSDVCRHSFCIDNPDIAAFSVLSLGRLKIYQDVQ